MLVPGRAGVTGEKAALAAVTNPRGIGGQLPVALAGADVFVGLSGAGCRPSCWPEWPPTAWSSHCPTGPGGASELAAEYADIVATGRSDFPNQINNVLAFPGVFRGALDAGARRITEAMKLAAANAIFAVASEDLAFDGSCRARSTRGSPRRWLPRWPQRRTCRATRSNPLAGGRPAVSPPDGRVDDGE